MGGLEVDFRLNTAVLLLVGLVSGICGSMGLGGGSVLIVYLTVFAGAEQLAAQGINLIFFLPTAAVALFIYSKKGIIKWRIIFPIMLVGTAATVVSGFFVGLFKAELLKKLFGVAIVVYGVYELVLGKKGK